MNESSISAPAAEKKTILQFVMGLIYGKDGKFKPSVPEGSVRPKPAPVPKREA